MSGTAAPSEGASTNIYQCLSNKGDTRALGKSDLLGGPIIDALLDMPEGTDKILRQVELEERARDLGIKAAFDRLLNSRRKEWQAAMRVRRRELKAAKRPISLQAGEDGSLDRIENYLRILTEDPAWKNQLWFNELTHAPEWRRPGEPAQRWAENLEATLRLYIESVYGLHNPKKLTDALQIAFHLQPYHPVREAITALRWDGKPRLEEMLIRYLGAPDTAYTREVSRLIFAGGIHRAFRPGCKFDVMPVLVGLQQGEGKSTFVRWLAMDDAFFREVTVLEGQKGSEAVEGAWICEMAELLALRRAKDAEAVKGFISRQSDSYRRPYQRHTEDVPRGCIYIGTTNRAEFLTDVTGNRRFYPITCRGDGSDLFAREEEVRADIRQCWAEAYQRFRTDCLPEVANRNIEEEAETAREAAQAEDVRRGLIADYLENRREVCILELWREALQEPGKPAPRQSLEIADLLQGLEGWERGSGNRRFSGYGVQKYWVKRTRDLLPEAIE